MHGNEWTGVEATNAVQYVNENYISERPELSEHHFQVGMTIPEDRAALIHKASANRNIDGWLTKVMRTGLDLREQTFLHDVIAQRGGRVPSRQGLRLRADQDARRVKTSDLKSDLFYQIVEILAVYNHNTSPCGTGYLFRVWTAW